MGYLSRQFHLYNKMSSMHDNVSISASSLGQTSKYSIDPASLIAATNAPTKFAEFKISPAFEKGLTKVNCGLCRMYFHKDSVFYKVPNNRIISLQKSWHFTQIGRRYQTASFLYKSVTVCTFCSQFFHASPDEIELENHRSEEKLSSTDYTEKQILNVSTTLQRSDIAVGHKVYQSSELDSKSAANAIIPPYDTASKTRREVDPWWEMDLGRGYRVHSISFLIATGIKQDLGLHIILLDRPYGFDDPFLDNIIKKAVIFKEYPIPQSAHNRMEEVTWVLPNDTQCEAIRIQLKGIHSLSVQKFQVFQGDNMVDLSNEAPLSDLRENSFLTLGPHDLKTYLSEMMSPEKKKKLVEAKYRSLPQRTFNEKLVDSLSASVREKYEEIDAWRARVLQHAEIFSETELTDLYQVIFKYVADVDARNKNHPGFPDTELLGAGLTEHYPRCDLGEIHTRIRSIVRWYQTRTHLKLLGTLANCSLFAPFAVDPTEYLFKLKSCFNRVEYYWNKREKAELRKAARKKSLSNQIQSSVEEYRGCSWSQFVIIMNLFCMGESLKIPKLAFNIEEERVSNPMYLSATGNEPDDKSIQSASIKSNEGRTVSTFSLTSSALPILGGLGAGPSSPPASPNRLDALAFRAQKPFEEFPAENKNSSILEVVRKETQLLPYNSAFAEYKFGMFKRRQELTDISFPKTLSLEFAKSLIPRRAATSHGAIKRSPSSDETAGGFAGTSSSSPALLGGGSAASSPIRGEYSTPGTLSRMATSKSLGKMSEKGDDDMSRVSDYSRASSSFHRPDTVLPTKETAMGGGKKANNVGFDDILQFEEQPEEFKKGIVDFFRICALCEVKFPRDCMQMKVMRKHIVKLRLSWNPKLISKEIRLLDNTLSMYSLVSICVFCTQFFDPDSADGISYPQRDIVEKKSSQPDPIQSIKSQNAKATMDIFYDSRFESSSKLASDMAASETNATANALKKRHLETRERARRATLIAETQQMEIQLQALNLTDN